MLFILELTRTAQHLVSDAAVTMSSGSSRNSCPPTVKEARCVMLQNDGCMGDYSRSLGFTPFLKSAQKLTDAI